MAYNRNYYTRAVRTPKAAHLTEAALLDRINALAKDDNVDQWTRDFCVSIAAGFKKYKGLTQKQFDIFVKREHQATPEFKQAREDWRLSYDDDKRETARICAAYYKANPPYFADLADKILAEDTFIPSPRQFNAITKNKYAQKVLKAHQATAAFPVGSFVELRANGRRGLLGALNKGTIIAVGAAPVTSAAKGSKVYQVLPFAAPSTVEVEERYLKKLRGLKK